jgi:hypothetical protein
MESNIQNILSEYINEKGIINIISDFKRDMELYDKYMKSVNEIKKNNRKHIKYRFKTDNPYYHKLIITNYKLKRKIFLADGKSGFISPHFCTEIRYFDYMLLTNNRKAYKLNETYSREIEDVLSNNEPDEYLSFNVANEWTLIPY